MAYPLKLVLLCWVLGSHLASAAAADIAVVVRREVPTDNISFAEIRKLFLGDRQFWASNLPVTLLIQPPGARERSVALKTICQMTEAQFRQHWIAKVFRADVSTGPKVVASHLSVIEIIEEVPGAVALLDVNQVPKGLKILKVDGRLPGDTDYKLH